MPSRVLTEQFKKTQARTRRAILIVTFSILSVGSISAWQLYRLGGDADSALASYEAIHIVGALNEALLSAETGQRGFLITRERSYLVSYSEGVRAIPELVEQMRDRLAPYVDAEHQAAIEAALTRRIREMAEVLELYESGQPGEAFSAVRASTGKVVMDNLREMLDLVRSTEEARLASRYAGFHRTRSLGLLSILSVGVFAILFTFFMLRGQHAANQRLLAAVNIIQRQKGYLEAMLSSVQAPLMLLDLDSCIRFVNAASVQLLSEPEEQLIGRPLQEFVQFRGASELPEDETIFDRAISERRVFRERRVGIQTRSGPQVIGLTVRPVEGEGGMPIGCMITLRDLEEKEAAVEDLHQQDRLRDLEANLGRIVAETVSARAFLERCSEAVRQTSEADDVEVWLVDAAGASATLRRVSTQSSDHDLDPSALILRVWRTGGAEEDRTTEPAQFAFPLASDAESLGVIALRTRVPLHPRLVTELPSLSKRIALGYDRRRIAETIAQLAIEKDRFIATLSHELRGPLVPLKYAVGEITASQGTADQTLLGLLSRQVQQLERLVDDLLDVQRLQRGTLSLRAARFDLRCAIEQSVEAVLPITRAKKQTLRVDLEAGEFPVNGDRARLIQVVLNVLNNASRYSAPGSKIDLRARRSGSIAEIRVADEGIGIAEENLERVFHLFEQGSTGGDAEGLGIGLALVRQLIELHGGHVHVSSPGVGKGSTFSLTIPLARQSALPEMVESLTTDQPRPSRTFDRCVVVDDDVDTADTLALMLKSFGLSTETAYEPSGALEAIQTLQPELVFLDLTLPGQKRFSLISELRSRWGAGIRVIAVTGHADDAVRREALEHGFDDLLVKPISPAQVAEAAARPRGVKSL